MMGDSTELFRFAFGFNGVIGVDRGKYCEIYIILTALVKVNTDCPLITKCNIFFDEI